LLRHAKATVPFYKTRLDPLFKKNGEIDWNRWHEIPIVTRADLRDRREQMLTTALPPGHGPTKTFQSSGSSGVPVSMEVTSLASSANRAATMRQLAYHGIKSNKTHAQLVHVNENGEFFEEEFYYRDSPQAKDGSLREDRDVAINHGLTDRRKLQLLKQLAVGYLLMNSNTAELLARANLAFGEGVKLDTIFCTGQQLTADQKDLFKESFGARGNIIYSSKEGGVMGFECGDGPNFHVNSELALLETATPEGGACEIGQVGRVIITPFFSTALPLIRYDQEDTATFLPPCGCKGNLPILGSILGRQDQLFKLPNGPRSITGVGAKFMIANLNALAFQLAQTAPLEMEVRYVPIDSTLETATEPIIARLRKLIHPEMAIVFKPVAEIAVNSGGKLQRYVCEIA
jgi:phenylacetate-CoA ligase